GPDDDGPGDGGPGDGGPGDDGPGDDGPDDDGPDDDNAGDDGLETGAGAPSSTNEGGRAPSSTDEAGAQDVPVAEEIARTHTPYRPKLFTVSGTGTGESGRRSRAVTSAGRRIGATKTTGQGGSIHLTETIRAAAPHQVIRGRVEGALTFRAGDLRVATKEGHESNLILFCVDASGSMAAKKRMEQVKTAILSLLLDAYQRRDKVGLITFRGNEADLALPPTNSVDIAAARLEQLPAGGRTPLAEGLLKAADVLRLEKIRDPRRRSLLVVVTDGRATSGADAVRRSRQVAVHLAAQGTASLVIDCEVGRFRMGLAGALATDLMAEHVPVGEVSATALTGAVRGRLDAGGSQLTGGSNEGAA
uniref:vWA domain-containing protein n=1 Tax=Nocardioides jensenii TaxID=1843 RepID=UPI000AF39621